MEEMFKLSEWEFKTTRINMLRATKDKVDNMQKQMGHVNTKMVTRRIKMK